MTDIPTRPQPYLITLNPDHVSPLSRRGITLATIAEELDRASDRQSVGSGDSPAAPRVRRLGVRGQDPHTLAVTLDSRGISALKSQYGDALLIEPDIELDLFDSGPASGLQRVAPGNFFALGSSKLVLSITVTDPDGAAVPLAEVRADGTAPFSSDKDVTNARGRAEVTLYGETPTSLRALQVKPSSGFWGRLVKRPDLSGVSKRNGKYHLTLTVTPILSEGHDETDIWGYRAMALHNANDEEHEGRAPVRIAIIDSGISPTHETLSPAGGEDFTDRDDPEAWREDLSGHGTHVAGTCGADFNGRGICGAAGPGAGMHGLSVFPGGRTSSIIAALDWCIDKQIDVANMSLGGPTPTKALEDAVARAAAAGVFMVAAAGNSAGPVMYPAAFEKVVAVAAIGETDSFPSDSPHANHRGAHQSGRFFSAEFTCFGPEIDVAAPGVAVISTVPSEDDAGYAAWDGTSMASPYVAGFAARLLSARPSLRDMARGAERVAALRDALFDTCTDLGLPRDVQGRGMPIWPAAAPSPGGDDTATILDRLKRISKELEREIG